MSEHDAPSEHVPVSEHDAVAPAPTSPDQAVWNEEVTGRARVLAARRFAVLAGRGDREGGGEVLVAGVFTALVAVGVVFLAMVYSYGYLWISSPVWPPEGSPSRPLPASEVVGLLAGAALLVVRGRAVEGVRRAPAVAAALGGVVVAAYVFAAAGRDLDLTVTAYGGIVGTLTWTVGVFAAGALALTVGVWWQERQGALSIRQRRALAAVVTQCWWFVVGTWTVTWVLLFVGARSA